jgi:hypothetical protein
MSSKSLICALQFLVVATAIAYTDTAYRRGRGCIMLLDHFDNILRPHFGDSHIVEPVVVVQVLIVEPWAIASLPGCCANHTELSCATTIQCQHLRYDKKERNLPSHMIAAFLQLYECLAIVASLPTFLLGHLHQSICLRIFGTLPPSVKFAIA